MVPRLSRPWSSRALWSSARVIVSVSIATSTRPESLVPTHAQPPSMREQNHNSNVSRKEKNKLMERKLLWRCLDIGCSGERLHHTGAIVTVAIFASRCVRWLVCKDGMKVLAHRVALVKDAHVFRLLCKHHAPCPLRSCLRRSCWRFAPSARASCSPHLPVSSVRTQKCHSPSATRNALHVKRGHEKRRFVERTHIG